MMRRKILALAVCVSLALQGCASFEVARTTSEREAGIAKKSMEEISQFANLVVIQDGDDISIPKRASTLTELWVT